MVKFQKLGWKHKGTVSLIRKRSCWNFSNLKPRDPVILALCSQEAFQKAWDKAKRRVEKKRKIIERRKKLKKRKFRTINRLKNIT